MNQVKEVEFRYTCSITPLISPLNLTLPLRRHPFPGTRDKTSGREALGNFADCRCNWQSPADVPCTGSKKACFFNFDASILLARLSKPLFNPQTLNLHLPPLYMLSVLLAITGDTPSQSANFLNVDLAAWISSGFATLIRNECFFPAFPEPWEEIVPRWYLALIEGIPLQVCIPTPHCLGEQPRSLNPWSSSSRVPLANHCVLQVARMTQLQARMRLSWTPSRATVRAILLRASDL